MTGIFARQEWGRTLAPIAHGRSSFRAALLAGSLAATALLAGPAAAQPAPQVAPDPSPAAARWTQPFAPEVGSRWRIAVDITSTETVGPTTREAKLTQRYDLAFTAREGTGYRVTLVLRDVSLEGNMPALQQASTTLAPFRDLVVKGITDADGLPVRVVNEAEVRVAAAAMGERVIAPFADKPQTAALMRQALAKMLTPKNPAATWLDPLPTLASAQSTPLRPGEEHRTASALASPFGGLIRSETVTRLAPDARPERFTILATTTPDAGSLTGAVLAAIRQIAATRPKDPDLNERAAKLSLSQSALDMGITMEIDVAGGMTRRARTESTIRANIAGQSVTGTRITLVTVTPAS